MRKYFYLLFVLISFYGCYQATTVKQNYTLIKGQPSSEGVSPERLGRIDSMLQQAVAEDQIPGAVALIARNGKIIYHQAHGMADNEDKEALSKDAIFRVASQTKAITATAVMILWEEGRFRLDDPVSKYIPEFKSPQILDTFNEADSSYTTTPSEKEITIRHLLTHTSGIGYGVIDGDPRFKKIYHKAGITDLYTTKDIKIKESVLKLAKLPLHHEPGQNFTYSEGLDVLGYFIEVVSEMPFDEFLKSRIFEPLGMEDTWFYLPENKYDRLVTVQHKVDGTWKKFPVTFYDPEYPVKGAKSFFSGGAGLSSTAKDYAKFLQMYLNNGKYNGTQLLSPTTIKSIMSNQIGDIWAGGGKDYGLAFGLVNINGVANGGEGGLGTFDWGGYFNTQYFADPENQLIGILMKQTQGTTNDETGWKFRQMVFAAIED